MRDLKFFGRRILIPLILLGFSLKGLLMLFSEKQLSALSDGVFGTYQRHCKNAAGALRCMEEVSRSGFHDTDMTFLVHILSQHFNKQNLSHVIQESHPTLADCIGSRKYLHSFMRYYYVRLPFLFVKRYKGPIRNQEGVPNIEEFKIVSKKIGVRLEREFPESFKLLPRNIFDELWENYQLQSGRFKLFKIKQRIDINDQLYDYSGVWEDCAKVDSWFDSGCNSRNFLLHVFESCFPMFWDSLETEYHDRVVQSRIWFI